MYSAVVFALGWFLRQVAVKFILCGIVFEAVVLLVPLVASFVTPYISTSSLNTLLGAIPDAMYWFFYFLRLDVGMPLVIGACVSRFLIRRIPFLG